MRTVSFQGVQLSATQRLRADQQARLQASMRNRSHLDVQVEQTMQAVQKAKEQGTAKPFKQWQVIHTERGTLFLGDVFGYGPALSCDPLPDGDDSDWQAYQHSFNQPGNSALQQ
ncbi:hypothetical protein [Pseudomonas citronellolis]|uniref:hypothetical protein n=1 Tax=Pseudomonas citronellolis TaxID=53408 RepID=UPI002D78ECAA|nr:hypothetical protein [Pseudomonas citronellolis]WRT81708.1 hypothetical protein VK748_25200 [Pseudomonas citronellolis]WRT81720.1 hypothetical protein VK748_25260 [Pseudomonas citronellolis]